MKPLSLTTIANAIGAAYSGPDVEIREICDDTRQLTDGCLFVALAGDNFDGHDYIEKALAEGAAFAVSQRPAEDSRVLLVKDTRQALLDIAGLYRKLINPKVVAITGSVGKTTTKEMTACVLQSKWNTLKTPANLNNEVGLSHTILSLKEGHEAAVLELGVDGPGQMESLAVCAAPDVGIITMVGDSHLANYRSREGILQEKLNLRGGMADGAYLLIPAENDVLTAFADPRLRVLHFGVGGESDVRAGNLLEENGQTRFDIFWQGNTYPVRLPTLGLHNVRNALAGFAAGVLLGIDPHQAAKALADYRPEGMRQKLVFCGNFTVSEDCYNASPDSMRAAFATMAGISPSGRRIAILSDMLELGDDELAMHYAIGKLAAQNKVDTLLCTGERSKEYVKGAQDAGLQDARHYPDQDALLDAVLALQPDEGDLLWFKASHGMHMENLLNKLYKHFPG